MARVARRFAAGVAALLVAGVLAAAGVSPAAAQDDGADPAAQVPPKVEELLRLLDDPSVRAWMQERGVAQVPADAASATAPEDATPSTYIVGRFAAIRLHVAALIDALPDLPREFDRAGTILSLELEDEGPLDVILLFAGFAALGFGAELLYRLATGGVRRWLGVVVIANPGMRLRLVLMRMLVLIAAVAAFAAGSLGAFLAFDWPPLLEEIVVGYLVAFILLRLALVFGHALMAPATHAFPDGPRFRMLPLDDATARFWQLRLAAFVGWLAVGWVTVGLLDTLGFARPSVALVAYLLGLGLLAIGLEVVWRRPQPAPGDAANGGSSASSANPVGRAACWLLSTYFVVLWLLWVASAMPGFWLAVVAIALPAAFGVTRRASYHVLRPAEAALSDPLSPGVAAASLARGLRALLIIGATFLLAWKWQIDLVALTAHDSVYTRLLRSALNIVVIVLVADLAWHVVKALIDAKIAEAQIPGQVDSETARRRSRLRTLLPILRNMLLIVFVVMTVLMALAAMGIDIGPLIAGAGVVGVAIGFGAQTLVKDVISGVFFLLDDAFRIGEYIQSGDYKGTVESFSLRSVKLRHHRGPLYTVPFGELGAVQNMSRDWVIEKLSVGVTYDSDLEKAKKLIKQIGKDLMLDPELGPNILETLKMQGIEQFGDFAIQLRMKMTTKPGEQFVIRRRAYSMLKKAFDANGIRFAMPTVHVAGGDDNTAAAARHSADLLAQKALEAP